MLRPPARRRAALPLLALLALTGLAGCSVRATDPLVEAGRELFRAFDPEAPGEGFETLNRFVIEQSSLASAVAAGLARDEDDDTRFAAIYVLGLSAAEGPALDALAGALEDELPSVRLLAGGALIGLGREEAIPVLIELLATTDAIPGSQPAVFVDRFASDALRTYTEQDFGTREAKGGAARLEAQQRWRDWWASVADRIEWDPASGRYEA